MHFKFLATLRHWLHGWTIQILCRINNPSIRNNLMSSWGNEHPSFISARRRASWGTANCLSSPCCAFHVREKQCQPPQPRNEGSNQLEHIVRHHWPHESPLERAVRLPKPCSQCAILAWEDRQQLISVPKLQRFNLSHESKSFVKDFVKDSQGMKEALFGAGFSPRRLINLHSVNGLTLLRHGLKVLQSSRVSSKM